jgi:hypothetical protein
VTVQVVVGGQTSNTLVVPVRAPTITNIDLFDPTNLSPAQAATDPCAVAASAITHTPRADVVEITGNDFGRSPAFTSVTLTAINSSATATCDVCHVTDRMARCVTTAAHSVHWWLVVTTVGQASAPEKYWYLGIMAPPAITSITPLHGPTAVSDSDDGDNEVCGQTVTTWCLWAGFRVGDNHRSKLQGSRKRHDEQWCGDTSM